MYALSLWAYDEAIPISFMPFGHLVDFADCIRHNIACTDQSHSLVIICKCPYSRCPREQGALHVIVNVRLEYIFQTSNTMLVFGQWYQQGYDLEQKSITVILFRKHKYISYNYKRIGKRAEHICLMYILYNPCIWLYDRGLNNLQYMRNILIW